MDKEKMSSEPDQTAQVRKNSVDFTKQPSRLSDFDQKSKSSQSVSEVSDIDRYEDEINQIGMDVQSIQEAQQVISNVQQQVMNLRLGMGHLHAILSDIEKRLGAARMSSQQVARVAEVQEKAITGIKIELS